MCQLYTLAMRFIDTMKRKNIGIYLSITDEI